MAIESTKLFDDLQVIRLVIFLETNPQSNSYRQIMLNKEQFKEFTIMNIIRKKLGTEMVEDSIERIKIIS